MRSTFMPLLALALAVPVITGCGKDARNSVVGPETGALTTVAGDSREAEPNHYYPVSRLPRVMFVHASPDAPAVDIRVGWYKVARSLEFPNNTPYKRVLAGDRRVRVNIANTWQTVIDARVKLERSKVYSVFAVDRAANIAPLVLTDDLTAPAKGNAHVRFIHLSPGTPAVDVALANGGDVVFPNKMFKDFTAFTPLPEGTYDLEVRLAGSPDPALPLPGIKLEAGKIYTVFAKGVIGGKGAQALGAGIIVNADYSRGMMTKDEVEPLVAAE